MSELLLRWGRAEYEHTPLIGLPIPVVEAALSDPIESVPLEEATVVVVPSKRPIGPAEVARLQRCKLVITTTSGHDHLDKVALQAAGIQVARLPLARRDAVVQTALGMMLSLTRRLGVFTEYARQDFWARAELPSVGATLLGRVGVIGAGGVIGRKMVEVLSALGAEVWPCDPVLGEGSVPLERVLGACPVVTLHCELTGANQQMIGKLQIEALLQGAILVNTARGGLVDVHAALDAVHSGHLGGLGLDVFPREPCSLEQFSHPNVLVSPHAAGWHPRLGEDCNQGVIAAVNALLQDSEIPFRVC